MKNMKVRMKLILGFLVVAIFAAAVGVSGIVGMVQMDRAASDLYDNETKPLTSIATLKETLQRIRVGMREYTIGVAADDMGQIDTAYSTISTLTRTMTEQFESYYSTLKNEESKTLLNEARTIFTGDYQRYLQQSYDYAKAGNLEGCIVTLKNAKADTEKIVANLDRCMEIRVSSASDTNDSTTELAATLLVLVIILLILALAAAFIFASYISRIISKPLITLTEFMQKAGTTGDITLRPEDLQNIGIYAQNRDETGVCIASTAKFVQHVTNIASELGMVADGDLTAHIEVLSDKDVMGMAMKKMTDNLCNMFAEINASTAQVSIGSKQIADGAQALAQGSTEQAASVQELSSSIAEIAEKTKTNADMAGKAAGLANNIMDNAEKGSRQMDEMMAAVKEINVASQSINKVIKVIDDIAFQTNILALNAAVEAARAGQHGKGFAVVAEEVRNLAAKSAEAAKETGSMIANSIEKAELGSRIADETSVSLSEIVSGINESASLVGEIAKSSEEQSIGISQINRGIDQVAQVVQQNSATAEQSAAASEQMSGQADMLESLIAQFKINDSATNRRQPLPSNDRTANVQRFSMPPKSYSATSNNQNEGYGKY